MNIEIIDEVLEALLFLSGTPLSAGEICAALELQKSEVNHSLKRLKAKYSGKCGIHLITYNDKIQFGTNPTYADMVATMLSPIKEKELSRTALETIAIVAYKQPITRLEVEQIRGVNSDYSIQSLLSHKLIEPVGQKDSVGKPILYGTTEIFLKKFGLDNIRDLPAYQDFVARLQSLEQPQVDESIYNEFELKIEQDTPEFLQGEEVEIVEV